MSAWRPPREPTVVEARVVPVGTGWNERFVEAWRKDIEARGHARETIKGYDSSIRAFVDWCSLNKLNVLDVGPKELRAYFDDLRANEPISIDHIGNKFTALSNFYDFLEQDGDAPYNFVPDFRRRYLKIPLREGKKRRFERRPFLSVGQMRRLVRSISDVQEKLLVVLAAKTGVRVGELVAIDVIDIDWKSQSIKLKPQRKRTHLWVFFDPETERLLRKWINIRELWTKDDAGPLFLGTDNARMKKGAAGRIVVRTTQRIGLYKPGGEPHEKVTPHTFRHFFTTHLHRAGMKREHIKVLRGDALPDTMDIYLTIDWDELRKEYLRCVPLLAGGPKPRADKRREAKTKNPSFGFLTPQEIARTGKKPSATTLELRQRIANDIQRGKLRRPAHYVDWLMKQGKTLENARPTVSHQLRILGVPDMTKGPRTGEGWTQLRKQLRDKARTTTKKRTR